MCGNMCGAMWEGYTLVVFYHYGTIPRLRLRWKLVCFMPSDPIVHVTNWHWKMLLRYCIYGDKFSYYFLDIVVGST